MSTDRQADSGVSLPDQRAKIVAYAALYDVVLVDVVSEAASGKSLDRPGLGRCLAALVAGVADAMLVVKLDRLTRSVRDLGTLVGDYFASRYTLLSVQDHIDTRTAAGRLVLNVLASVSQWEREKISETTRSALQYKRSRGERLGRPRYGWRVEAGQLVSVPSEQALIVEMRRLAAEGLGPTEIARRVGVVRKIVARELKA